MEEKPKILEELEQIQEQALAALEQVNDLESLQNWRREMLGRSSAVMSVFSNIGVHPKEIRPLVGQVANQVKQALEAALDERSLVVKEAALAHKLSSERLDVTLPGRRPLEGGLHPQTKVLRRIYAIFAEMGFQVYRSRDVESDEYNFEAFKYPGLPSGSRYVGHVSCGCARAGIKDAYISGADPCYA